MVGRRSCGSGPVWRCLGLSGVLLDPHSSHIFYNTDVFLILIEGLRTVGVVCCTDSKAPWGKLLFGLYKKKIDSIWFTSILIDYQCVFLLDLLEARCFVSVHRALKPCPGADFNCTMSKMWVHSDHTLRLLLWVCLYICPTWMQSRISLDKTFAVDIRPPGRWFLIILMIFLSFSYLHPFHFFWAFVLNSP